MLWIETRTDEDARRRSERLWTSAWSSNPNGTSVARVPGPDRENGQFWGEAIKAAEDSPTERLAIARRQLPLPGAFSQITVARRAIIRQLRKEREPIDGELHALHYWAALSSWGLPYSEVLREPGFNVFESTPYAKFAALDLSYDAVGCDELRGLTQTDRKWMRELWGEPRVNTTAQALYSGLWREQERKLAAVRERRRADLLGELTALAKAEQPMPSPR